MEVLKRAAVRPENACANMVLMGLRGYSMPFDERRVLAWVYQRHTSRLRVDRPSLQDTILRVVDRGREVLEAYRRMALERLSEPVARRIAESELPLRVLPDFIEVETLEDGRRALKGFSPQATLWDAYNSVSAAIWHNAKSDISTKLDQFNVLHAALPLAR